MIIAYALISLVAYFFYREYAFINRQTLMKYFPVVLILWIILLITFFIFSSPGIGNSLEGKMFFIALISFSIFNLLFLLYLKMCFEKHILYLILFLPITSLFILNLLLFNKPTYNGAMDGFASIINLYLMSMILISYPTFLFSFSMLKFSNIIKGAIIIILALGSGFLGVKQSIGIEGFLADDTGNIFAYIIFILFVIGISNILSETKMKFNSLNKRKTAPNIL